MNKIIVFGATTSSNSINKELASYASSLEKTNNEFIDMLDYDCPIYSEQLEKESGKPELAKILLEKLQSADRFIVSVVEHNSGLSAVFKNIYDWVSRIDRNLFNKKPMLLMSASPGVGTGKSSLAVAKSGFPQMDAEIIAEFSLASFYDNFKDGKIISEELNTELLSEIKKLQSKLV